MASSLRAKVSKSSVHYRARESSGVAWLRCCADCIMFNPGLVPSGLGSCTLVESDPLDVHDVDGIDPDKVCDEWEAL